MNKSGRIKGKLNSSLDWSDQEIEKNQTEHLSSNRKHYYCYYYYYSYKSNQTTSAY